MILSLQDSNKNNIANTQNHKYVWCTGLSRKLQRVFNERSNTQRTDRNQYARQPPALESQNPR
jgi:hypothetical protein